MKAGAVLAATIIVPLFLSVSHAAAVKPGWNRENREKAVQGCATALMERHMESVRKGLYKPEREVSRQIKKATPQIRKKYVATCRCVIDRAARRWSLSEFDEVSGDQRKWQEFLTGLFCSGACALPFDFPLNCP